LERLDKILSNSGYGSRKETKALIKKGLIKVDGIIAKDSGLIVDIDNSNIEIGDTALEYKKYIYLMMNKPEGVVSATFDNYDKTVIDLLEEKHQAFKPFPVGRLDKDTIGLLILTNDGELNHRVTSPKWHVDKIYQAVIDNEVTASDVEAFKEGIVIEDECKTYKCMAAELQIITTSKDCSKVLVKVQEGKFHQVKKMFLALGKKVIFLERISFGNLELDRNLELGQYRELSKEEVYNLKAI